ncbi:response regulator transcription factor [Paenibacillus sp. HB172176]|uniref:response regulator transcription factor n=1 Tax=Paenibacillus sp. HB172176 TaxID=2493690 RepID=UPI00143A9AEF|nr:response regulator transcription factor [Paenibacillus sp. HB172176]
MYKVLLVDDERIILEGISAIVAWERYGAELAGTARNGIEALSFIESQQPDIVISDIRMPGMDGLKLAETVHEKHPSIVFIMLSGFSEFDYARQAMQHGVKQYLLKPCNENTIGDALKEAVEQLDQERKKDAFLTNLQEELIKVVPRAKEQFLKELVTNKMYGRNDWERYRELFGIDIENTAARLLLFQLEGQFEFEHLFALKNIAEDIVGRHHIVLSTTIGNQALLLIRNYYGMDALLNRLGKIRNTFRGYYRLDATIAVSDAGELTHARQMYLDTLRCMSFRFYLGEGGVITIDDIRSYDADSTEEAEEMIAYDDSRLCLLAKSGNWEEVRKELRELFRMLEGMRLDDAAVKSYMLPIYAALIRQTEPSRMIGYLKELGRIGEMATLTALKAFVEETARAICEVNFKQQKNKHSAIIAKMIAIVEEHLGNSELSLQWVANEILYMNGDYLGKLFRKEAGEKFSHYVTRMRMEAAIEHIGNEEDVKVFELAEKLGYGDNPQYFSSVFKKHTGVSPSEYKRMP